MKSRKISKASMYCLAIISTCYLYAGSAYMSQFYRLMEYFDDHTVDIITSGFYYLLQAAGIALFSAAVQLRPKWFNAKKSFLFLLMTGIPFMLAAQLSQSAIVIVLTGSMFQLHTGFYLGYYLTLLCRFVPPTQSGGVYGIAYAIGSLGTYLISLPKEGTFLTSDTICSFYLALAIGTGLLAIRMDERPAMLEDEPDHETGQRFRKKAAILIIMVTVMTFISVMGSGLFYSIPQAQGVNWNLIRAFYAAGLVLAGLIMDRNRKLGGICTVASLTYPLIAIALSSEGVTGTVSLSLSYFFRGFLSIYYVTAFTDLGCKTLKLLPLAPAGLFISRITEAILTFLLTSIPLSQKLQIALTALFFAPLIIFFYLTQAEPLASPELDASKKKDALFAEKYGLTSREAQILDCLCKGMSDKEIAEQCFISHSTVRFHVSNLLKKTGTTSRTEVVRAREKY